MGQMLGTADLDLLQSILEPLPDCPFFVKNSDLRYVAANSAMAQLCGVRDAAALIGLTAERFFPALLAQEYRQLDLGVPATGLAVTDRLHLTSSRRHDHIALLFTRTPIHDHAGIAVGICGTARWLADSPQLRRLMSAVDYMRDNLDQPLTLGALTGLAGISTSQLERDFRKIFRMSLRDFQHKLRLGHALQLLRETRSPIADVALSCGYTDQSAFTRQFRKMMGTSPSAHRRKLILQN